MPRQKTSPSDYPQAVVQQIELLAQNIVVARKRRKETQAQWAQRLGVSQPTMARIEKGDPSVAMASYVMCLWLINPAASLADLIAPQHDAIALEREVAKVRPRAHAQKVSKSFVSAPAGMAVARPKNAIYPVKVISGDEHSNMREKQKFSEQQSATDIARSMSLGPLGEIQKLHEQQSAAEIARSLGLDSFNEIQKFREQQSAADIARNMGLGTLGEMQKLHEQQSAAEVARSLGFGSTRTAAGLAALIAKKQGTLK
jgi:DNA-binding XRE family transcriptional regulator